MERISARDGVDGRIALSSPEANTEALPSRSKARESIRGSIDSGLGFWLLSGDAGVGKTWTWRGMAQASNLRESWLVVDVTPGITTEGLYQRIVHLLGLSTARPAREMFLEWLDIRALEDAKTILVLEECQNASAAFLEEIRVLVNQLDLNTGFASIGLVGQTELLRRLNTKVFWPIASRITCKVHLRSLDTDDVGSYLSMIAPERHWTASQVEAWQVVAAGNPRLIRQRLSTLEPVRRHSEPISNSPISIPSPSLVEAVPTPSPAMLGPSKPPIRLEAGVIEVGWSPDEEEASSSTAEESEFAINDRYAALQAWNESSKAQAPSPPVTARTVVKVVAPPPPPLEEIDDPSEEVDDPSSPEPPWVRTDDHHEHSPFSPMFTRLKRATDAE